MKIRDKVYEIIKKVPVGKVTTYGDIGHKIGTKAFRAIGQVLHHNPRWLEIPCHRVVMKDGSLAPNYGHGGPSVQRSRLEKEGVGFIGEKVDIISHKADL